MYDKTLDYGMGYTGKMGNKCWIAEITGTDDRYGLARCFLDADEVEREHYTRPRTIVHLTWHLGDGLYEYSESGERTYLMVWTTPTGETGRYNPPEERVEQMARLMASGQSFEAARIATRKPEKVAA